MTPATVRVSPLGTSKLVKESQYRRGRGEEGRGGEGERGRGGEGERGRGGEGERGRGGEGERGRGGEGERERGEEKEPVKKWFWRGTRKKIFSSLSV